MSQIHISRDYFLKLSNYVNSEAYTAYQEELTNIKPLHITSLADNNTDQILQNLNDFGYIILDFNSLEKLTMEDLCSWQESMLGAALNYKNPHNLPYCEISAAKDGKFLYNSSYSQPLHTDEGFTKLFPKYISLYCATQSNTGGISTLVDFWKIFPHLKEKFQDDLSALACPNAITVNGIAKNETKPILFNLDGTLAPGISYCATLKEMTCSNTVFRIFDYITQYCHIPKNQLRFRVNKNQLLILDNTRVLHGRTAFNSSDNRVLYRFWFNPCTL